MLGRWQPFHDGHLALFKEILKKTGQVVIMVRTMTESENNPFKFDEIKISQSILKFIAFQSKSIMII
jgi:nicotinamide mononucleotide adenylyltransferase